MWEVISSSYCQGVTKPKSFTLNEFDDQTLTAFRRTVFAAHDLGQTVLPIEIASEGGDANIMAGIMSIMEDFRGRGMRFSTCVSSRAMSAGALIFAFGDDKLRFIGSNASLMIHTIQLGAGGRISEVKRFVDFNWNEQVELLKKISKNLKKSANWLEKELAKRKDEDWFLNSQETLALGFASEIKIPVWQLELVPKIGYY